MPVVVAPRKPVQDAFIERPSGWFVPRPALPLNRGRLIRAAAAECDAGGSRSGFARLVLRGRFRSTVVGAGRRPFLLSLQLLVVSGLFGAVAFGTLKAIIRFAHQQTPGDLERSLASSPRALFRRAASRSFTLISSISNPRARAVCASPCGI